MIGIVKAGGQMGDDQFKEGQERYQAFLRNSQEGIWRVELDKPIPINLPVKQQLKLIYKHAWLAEANPAMARMYGFKSVKPLIGLRLGDLLIESDPGNIAYLTGFIKSDYKLSGVESHEKDRYGHDRFFRNSLVGIIQNGCVVRAWGTQQDVTEQHAALAARQRSEARLALALKATHMGIWEWDVKTGELLWSDELKRIFGLHPSEEITFDKYQQLIHPEDRARSQRMIADALKDGKSYQVEHRVIYADGSVHWILGQGKAFKENGKVSFMMGTSMLIDDRKSFEARVLESEARFRSMADTAPVLIWTADKEARCDYFNRPWLDFVGRTLQQEIGSGWEASVHPEDLAKCKKTFLDAYISKQPFRSEYRLKRHDGVYRHVLDSGSPRFSAGGEFLGFIGSCVDIEDVKDAIKRSTELEVTNAQLMELNSIKDEFISIASHQLRTPATGVKQYVGMVLEGFAGALNKEQIEMLKHAYESNERQINIINDMLRVAQIDAGKVVLRLEKCDVVELIEDVLHEQRAKFEARNQQLTLKAAKKSVVLADPKLMRMVIENIVDNAGKYSPVKSAVIVSVASDNEMVQISVKDFGVGIDKNDRTRLFQKFYRIQNHLTAGIEGSGLGLYWCKSIVDLHEGEITLKSKLNSGTTFTISLPIKRKQPKNRQKHLKKQR